MVVTPLIRVASLSKKFQRGEETIAALKDINLSVVPGEFLALTGSSGSGKSTLMHILGLLDRPSSGEYLLSGRPTSKMTDNERAALRSTQIGFIFQSFFLLPKASALRNVSMPLDYVLHNGKHLSSDEKSRRARESLNRVGLADRIRHLPNELSGGQRQRVAIARAIVNQPRIILADEPTGNLDSKTGNDIMSLFRELNSEGTTLIVVTHDRAVAAQASRQIVLRDGEIVEEIK